MEGGRGYEGAMKGLCRGYGGAMEGLWRGYGGVLKRLDNRMNIGILCYFSSNICSVRVKYQIEYGVAFKI